MSASETRPGTGLTFAVLVTAGTSYGLIQAGVGPALPRIQDALGTSEVSVSWIMTAFLLSASVATPLLGRLGDMYGKKRLLVIALSLLCFGTLLAGLSDSLAVLVVARVIQGVAAGLLPLATGIIRDEFPRPKVAGAIGFLSALLGIGGVIGLVFAGPVVDNLSLRYFFWLPLIPIGIATVLAQLFVPESPVRVPGRVNLAAAFLMSSGLVLVLLGVTQATRWHWFSVRTTSCFLAGAVLLVLWVRREARSEQPLVDMRMMRIRGVWTTNAVAFALGFGMWASFILVPQFSAAPSANGFGFDSTVTQAALFMLPAGLAGIVAGAQTGRLERRFGSKPPLVAGALLFCAGYVMLALVHSAEWEIYLAMLLLGTGMGIAFAAMVNLIVENVGPGETGVAVGMNSLMRSVGGAFGGAATAALLASVSSASGAPTERAYTLAFGLCAVTAAAAALIGLAVPQRGPQAIFEPHAVGDLVDGQLPSRG
jgi:MFS family permease